MWPVVGASARRAEQTRERAVAALRRMDATGRRFTFDAVARDALLTEQDREFRQFNG
ncbi:hypothetical protein NE236_26490 [Actinoallomurus purpureus]|uniref:hypothetical protein n=1 Tax=Actinoallomurus purpureus TaxID=478114 RepID=UPI0020931F4C|nr:hypothetical protein [Actinoallomurus purpureus]MCO6008527.1 hypothetical protein [Actinoallomurus purpureus]